MHGISPKIVLTFECSECSDGETTTSFICIPGKHNGTLLLTYEARTEQLE